MRYIKTALCVLVAVILSVFVSSCNTSSNVYDNENYYTKGGELTASPRFAYYNDGTEVAGLEELDKEIYDEGPVDDGSFTIYFAVNNSTPYDRKINSLNIKYIRTKDGYDIVEPSEFSMDSDVYIASGESRIIPCVFEKDFVLMQAKLKNLSSSVSISYEGCVVNGDEPQKQESGFSYSVKEMKFTSTNGIEGSFYIKNNNQRTEKIGKISFMLYTNEGKKITNKPVEMVVDTEIESGDILTLKYAVLPNNVSEDIVNNKVFDAIEIKVTEE